MKIRPPLRYSDGSGGVGNDGRNSEKTSSVGRFGASRSNRPKITTIVNNGSLLGRIPVSRSLVRLFRGVRRYPVSVDCSGDEVGIH
jgi:hypothetical protein